MSHKTVKKDGVTIPSVTTIINTLDKPGLCMWYGKFGTAECNRIKNEAATFGTNVHALIEAYLQASEGQVYITPEEGVSPEELACFNSFKEWYRTSGLVPICMEPEEAAISTTYNYQGTWDFIGRHDNAIIVADWKTSNQLYDTVGLQLAAYAQLYGESQGWDRDRIWRTIPHGLAVRIDKKTAKVYTKWYTQLEYYFGVFSQLIPVYDFVNKKGAWDDDKFKE